MSSTTLNLVGSASELKAYPVGPTADTDSVLVRAVGELSSAIIVGRDKNGELDVRANEELDVESAIRLLNRAKRLLEEYLD